MALPSDSVLWLCSYEALETEPHANQLKEPALIENKTDPKIQCFREGLTTCTLFPEKRHHFLLNFAMIT